MSFWNRLVERFRAGEGEEIDWEALLIEADLGVKLATEWVERLRPDASEAEIEAAALARDGTGRGMQAGGETREDPSRFAFGL